MSKTFLVGAHDLKSVYQNYDLIDLNIFYCFNKRVWPQVLPTLVTALPKIMNNESSVLEENYVPQPYFLSLELICEMR